MTKQNSDNLQWSINVPIFKNKVILKDMGLALGIPFGLLIFILLIVSGGDISRNGIGYPLILISMLFILSFIFIMLFYGGQYAAGYEINEKGILNYTQKSQAKRNIIVNSLLIIVGILSGKPSAAGAGLLAQSNQSVFIRWQNIRKVITYPDSRTIVIKGGFAEKIALFCNDDNFEAVKSIVLSRISMNGAEENVRK